MRSIANNVAIIGIAGTFPGTKSIPNWWNALLSGEVLTKRYSLQELKDNKVHSSLLKKNNYIPIRGHLDDILKFDNAFFGVNQRNAEMMDPQLRLMLQTSWSSLEDAGYGKKGIQPITGVFASSSVSNYMYELLSKGPHEPDVLEQIIHGNEKDFIATTISYKLNLTGPAMSIQTGCSSSLVGLHVAKQALLNRECDMALVVGAAAPFPQGGYLYQEGGIYSKTGTCSPFDANADGVIEGSGVMCVVLKRACDIEMDDVDPYALILGSAINNDGSSKIGYFAPSITGQTDVIKKAHDDAKVNISEISYIETHGTGTIMGDPIEWTSTTEAYKQLGAQKNQIAIGSVKANIGHLDAAAGLASLIKTALILKNDQIPPLANFNVPNPYLSEYEESPLYIPNQKISRSVDVASINSFGIGGTNAHVILGKFSKSSTRHLENRATHNRDRAYYLHFSANDTQTLNTLRQNIVKYINDEDPDIGNLSHTLYNSRESLAKTLSIYSTNREELLKKISEDMNLCYRDAANLKSSKIVLLFPGQGTQYPAMALPFLYIPGFRESIEFCLQLCDSRLQPEIKKALYDPHYPVYKLDQTELAQPSLFILEYSVAISLITAGLSPAFLLGHSLGEFTAMCISGMLSVEDAIKLVIARGKAMQSCPEGAMLHIGAPVLQVKEMIEHYDYQVSIAAVNTDNAIVVSGTKEQINNLYQSIHHNTHCEILRSNRSFHSNRMKDALPLMRSCIDTIDLRYNKIPVVCNINGNILNKDQVINPQYFLDHAIKEVQFQKSLNTLKKQRNVICIEVGPGRVLSSMSSDMGLHAISLSKSTKTTAEEVMQELLYLHCAGQCLSFFKHTSHKKLHAPAHPFMGKEWIAQELLTTHSTVNTPPKKYSPTNTENIETTDITKSLVKIWMQILRYKDISKDSNFFLLGGDSIMITTLIRKINETFDIQVSARDVLGAQQLIDQVSIIEQTIINKTQ